jgi:hypothetical protein
MTATPAPAVTAPPTVRERAKALCFGAAAWLAPPAFAVLSMILAVIIGLMTVRGFKAAKFALNAIVAFVVPYPFAAILAADLLRRRPLLDRVAAAVVMTWPLALAAIPALIALELWPL